MKRMNADEAILFTVRWLAGRDKETAEKVADIFRSTLTSAPQEGDYIDAQVAAVVKDGMQTADVMRALGIEVTRANAHRVVPALRRLGWREATSRPSNERAKRSWWKR